MRGERREGREEWKEGGMGRGWYREKAVYRSAVVHRVIAMFQERELREGVERELYTGVKSVCVKDRDSQGMLWAVL